MTKVPYDECIFINCPFTSDYEPLFRAMVFVIMDCGYVPRSALEFGGGDVERLAKIIHIIRECRYAVHDISCTELDPVNQLPRFNMPLELGLFIGARNFGDGRQKTKSFLVLDRESYRYQKYISDLAGRDIQAHKDSPDLLIRRIRDWLRDHNTTSSFPSAQRIIRRFHEFQSQLPLICESPELDPHELQFNDFTTLVEFWLRNNP